MCKIHLPLRSLRFDVCLKIWKYTYLREFYDLMFLWKYVRVFVNIWKIHVPSIILRFGVPGTILGGRFFCFRLGWRDFEAFPKIFQKHVPFMILRYGGVRDCLGRSFFVFSPKVAWFGCFSKKIQNSHLIIVNLDPFLYI